MANSIPTLFQRPKPVIFVQFGKTVTLSGQAFYFQNPVSTLIFGPNA